jgi:poly(hydroxyalkanoate) granule-associated protein
MVKKFRAMQDEAVAESSNLVGAIKDSAQQIWLAGLGAFAKAQEEGTKVFDVLVKEGMTLQKQTQKVAEAKVEEMAAKVTATTDGLSKQAAGTWDKLEQVFEERVSRTLQKLGVPTAGDVKDIVARLDEISAQLAKANKTASKSAAKVVAEEVAPVVKKAKAAVKKAVK